MAQAQNGDRVRIHFTGRTKTGEVFASSQEEDPIEFVIGQGLLLPGVEKAVEGMAKGEQKTVVLHPDDGFGERSDELIVLVEKNHFPDGFLPEEGMEFQIPQADGSIAFFKILEVLDSQVRLDGNHPLAGEALTFDLELIEIG